MRAWILFLLAFALVFAGCAQQQQAQASPAPDASVVATPVQSLPATLVPAVATGTVAPTAAGARQETPTPVSTPVFSGKVIAGKNSLLLEYNAGDYELAKASDKLVVLYFYANWCPICRAEFPEMEEVFNELETNQVIGFRVNFNDDETEEGEVALAREFGIAYQHSKVFLKNGQRVLKSPESWEKRRYFEEISRHGSS